MSATAHTAAPAYAPGPRHDRAAAYAVRLLGFVHKLIEFGIQLAATARHNPTGDALARLGVRFNTKNTAWIVARIARALRRAAKLEQRLAGGRLARLNPAQAAADSLCPHKPRAPRSPRDPSFARMPSAAKITRWLRHEPFEMVLMLISHELGLMHSNPLQTELSDILAEHFGGVTPNPQALAKPAPESNQASNTENKTDRDTIASLPPDMPLPTTPLRQPPPHMVSVATTATGPP